MEKYYLTEVEKIHDQNTNLKYYRAFYSNGFLEINEIYEIGQAIPTIILR